MLHPPGNRRERILIFGLSKQGKSTNWVDIAEWLVRTGSHNKMFVGDTDVAWEAMRPEDGHLDPVIVHSDLHELPSYKTWIDNAWKNANPDRNDWLVLDMSNELWDRTKGEFVKRQHGQELDEFYVEAGLGAVNASIGGAYGQGWDIVKHLYNGVKDKIHRFPGHVMCISTASEVRKADPKSGKGGETNQLIKDTFGEIGWKPGGQAEFAHLFHTVMLQQKSPSGYRLTTVGDRRRKVWKGEVVGVDGQAPLFVAKYLIGVAGWRP